MGKNFRVSLDESSIEICKSKEALHFRHIFDWPSVVVRVLGLSPLHDCGDLGGIGCASLSVNNESEVFD